MGDFDINANGVSPSAEAFFEELQTIEPRLTPLIRENVEYFEQSLPHLILSDVMRWMAEHSSSDRSACQRIMDRLEHHLASGTEYVQELVVVSGIENLPDPGERGSELRDLMGPASRRFDPWRDV